MTNPIASVPSTPLPPETTSTSSPPAAPKTPTQSAAATAQSESVTLSAAAQASTQLLSAARDASGVDQQAVERIRGALQGGSYNVAAQDLAQAIATVLKETN
jgi:flagellar biosynthesis anti-sigma factor FlgM